MNTKEKKNFWLYVLRLEQDKYYVGITTRTPEVRMQEHIFGYHAARWTRKYKPIGLHDTKDLGLMTLAKAELYENRVVRKYLKELGYNRTRGGDLTAEENYVARFGYIFTEDNWNTISIIIMYVLMLLVIVILYESGLI